MSAEYSYQPRIIDWAGNTMPELKGGTIVAMDWITLALLMTRHNTLGIDPVVEIDDQKYFSVDAAAVDAWTELTNHYIPTAQDEAATLDLEDALRPPYAAWDNDHYDESAEAIIAGAAGMPTEQIALAALDAYAASMGIQDDPDGM